MQQYLTLNQHKHLTMKQFATKFSIMAITLFLANAAKAYDFEVDGIYYNITSMSNLEVGVTYKEIV